MSATLMRGVLDQINTQSQQIAGMSRNQPAALKNTPSFSDILFNSINEMTQQWMSGSSDIGLNDVMLAMQTSSISFSFGVQARNKMLSAYQEIMNTPV